MGRGSRVKIKREIVISVPEENDIKKIIIPKGETGVVVEVIPNFTVRLDTIKAGDKICEIRWHASLRIGRDVEPLTEKPILWLVK